MAPRARSGSILLASPREWLASSLRAVLEPEGWELAEVATADALLTAVADSPPDVVILDEGLSDGSGRNMLSRFATGDDAIPILLYSSGDWESSDPESALLAGAWDVLVEPVRAHELLEKLARLGQLRSMLDASSAATGTSGPAGPYHLARLLRSLPLVRSIAERSGADLGCAVVGPTHPESDEAALDTQRGATLGLVAGQVRGSDLCAWIGPADLAVLLYGAGIDGLGAFVGRVARSGASRAGDAKSMSAGIVSLPGGPDDRVGESGRSDPSAVAVLARLDAARAALWRAREAGGGVRVASDR